MASFQAEHGAGAAAGAAIPGIFCRCLSKCRSAHNQAPIHRVSSWHGDKQLIAEAIDWLRAEANA